MVFSSIIFLLYFLPVFLIVYYLSPDKFKNLVLLFFSVFFYSWGAPIFVFALLGSTMIDFYLVREMDQSENQKLRRWLLALSIIKNAGFLVYFKYANFFVENFNFLLSNFGYENLNWPKIILPIGISFFTFQSITYAIDVYRKNQPALKNPKDYLLYILLFPHLIAGPIVRFKEISSQLITRTITIDDKLSGFVRFCIGLGKKVLIANVLAAEADRILNGDLNLLNTSTAWLGVIAYTLQIYFDFSGYSDMAIGLARMIGFRFPENFNYPYISKSITEFWRRWHITLGNWMRDYLYIPLGGNRVSSKRKLYFNLWLVFLISGFWHGASWNFILWGAFHGFFLIIERIFMLNLLSRLGKIIPVIYSFIVVALGWVLFRIEGFQDALIVYRKLFSFNIHPIDLSSNPDFFMILGLAIAFAFIPFLSRESKFSVNKLKQLYPMSAVFVACTVAILIFVLSVSSITAVGFNPFIYFRF